MKTLLAAIMTLCTLSAAHCSDDHYTFPGITAQKDGKWVGSDHMLNLPDSILVDADLNKPDSIKLDISADKIREIVSKLFKDAGIDPNGKSDEGKPPLPFFQVVVIIYNIPEGYAFSVDGRLFEEVHITRAKLTDGVFMQAITWNTDSIHVASTQRLSEELTKSVEDVTKSFIERYKFFKDLKHNKSN